MSARELWRGIGFGLIVSALGALVFHAGAPWIGQGPALRMTIVLVAAAAAMYTLVSNQARVGRFVAAIAWVVLIAALVVFDPSLWLWLLLPSFGLWLTRSLYRYHSLLAALVDGACVLLALGAAFVALRHTHSLFLALWCWFLLQASTAAIPRGAAAPAEPAPSDDPYAQARRSAESALRRLASNP